MREKVSILNRIIILFALFFSSLMLCGSIGLAEEPVPLAQIQQAITEKGANWIAGPTAVIDVPLEQLCGSKLHPDAERAPAPSMEAYPSGAPAALDWRDYNGHNWTTPIRNQGGCGSCYIFGTCAAAEAAMKVQAGTYGYLANPDLSEQFILVCDGVGSCGGGYSGDVLDYLETTGSTDETCFPYTASDTTPCSDRCSNWADRIHKIDDWNHPGGFPNWNPSVAQIKTAIQTYGPVSTYMRCYDDFKAYNGGVYQHVWGTEYAGHTVTLVGWIDSQQCWIGKNSWGTDWGETIDFQPYTPGAGDGGWFRIKWGEVYIERQTEYVEASLPNLTDYPHTGWTYSLVPRNTTGTTWGSCPLPATLNGNQNTTYLNFAGINNGTEPAPPFLCRFYVDGVYVWWATWGKILAGQGFYAADLGPMIIKGGRHTLGVYMDYHDEVWETNETTDIWPYDNIEYRQFVWSPYALSDDVPIWRYAPPIKDAWGDAPAPWYNNDGFSFVVQQEHPNKWWSAVGILPANSASDYDLRLWDIGDYTGSEGGFGFGYLEWSSYGGDASDFVIVNDNTAPAGTYYAGVINYNEGTADFRIEEDTSVKIYEGTNGPYPKASHNVLDIYECYLFEGEYGFKLVQISGNCDLGMSLYDDETVHCKKSEYMPGGYANNTGNGGDEFFKVDIPDAGFHGLVVWKVDSSDYNKSCTYKIKMGKCANPTTPSNPNPADGATDVSIYTNLDWADCANTDHYEVWLKKEGESWQKLGETEESEWDISGSLEYETTYTWTIKAVNICNNYTWSPYWTFTTSAEPKPELVVTSIHTSPVYPEPGETVNIQVTIKNQGDLDAGGFYTSFYKHRTSPPGVGEAGDLNWTLSSLAAGAYHTFNGTVRYSDIDCYQMYAQVDTYNDVKEGNETNNVYGPKNIIVGRCYGDFDNDGNVDKDDLAVFAAAFGSVAGDSNYNIECDFDRDKRVDGLDLALFAGDYKRTDCPVCP